MRRNAHRGRAGLGRLQAGDGQQVPSAPRLSPNRGGPVERPAIEGRPGDDRRRVPPLVGGARPSRRSRGVPQDFDDVRISATGLDTRARSRRRDSGRRTSPALVRPTASRARCKTCRATCSIVSPRSRRVTTWPIASRSLCSSTDGGHVSPTNSQQHSCHPCQRGENSLWGAVV